MKWLEIIELRTVDRNWESIKSKLRELIIEVEKATKENSIKTYSRVLIDTDFSIHLFHDSEKVDNQGSMLGLQVTSVLKEFGLVDHKIWVESK